jgi:predicted hydrocarbon binding protein
MTETTSGTRWLRLPAATLTALPHLLVQGRSPLEAATLLREIGYGTGEALSAALERWLLATGGGEELGALAPEQFWGTLSRFFEDLGWGTLRFERLHPGLAALDAREWAEADPESGAAQPGCHLSTGIFAELLGRAAGSEVAVMEVACRSRGDESCRFVFGSPETLRQVYDEMQTGAPLASAIERLG